MAGELNVDGVIQYEPSSGYYVNMTTGERMTLGQASALASQIQAAQSMTPIQYDEAGTRLTPDNVNAGTPQQQAAQLWAQLQQQPASLGGNPNQGLLTGNTVQNWNIGAGGAVTPQGVYSSGAGANFVSADAQAYFDRYPDLLPAYQANNYGMNPTQWAQAHFNNFGQGEQRQWGAVEPAVNTTYSNTATNTQYSPVAQPDNSYTIGPPPTWQDYLDTMRQQTVGVTPYNPNTQTTTPWQPNEVTPTPVNPATLSNAVDSSAWRAAPSALTALQQGGRGMLYS